jgi:hypothetical protein
MSFEVVNRISCESLRIGEIGSIVCKDGMHSILVSDSTNMKMHEIDFWQKGGKLTGVTVLPEKANPQSFFYWNGQLYFAPQEGENRVIISDDRCHPVSSFKVKNDLNIFAQYENQFIGVNYFGLRFLVGNLKDQREQMKNLEIVTGDLQKPEKSHSVGLAILDQERIATLIHETGKLIPVNWLHFVNLITRRGDYIPLNSYQKGAGIAADSNYVFVSGRNTVKVYDWYHKIQVDETSNADSVYGKLAVKNSFLIAESRPQSAKNGKGLEFLVLKHIL